MLCAVSAAHNTFACEMMQGHACGSQIVFQTQPKDDKALLQQERAAMLSRNDPSAPVPVEVLDGAKEVCCSGPLALFCAPYVYYSLFVGDLPEGCI